MDKEYAISNLDEARGHLQDLITALRAGAESADLDGELLATVQEVYWHINKVWNGRQRDQKDIDAANDAVFDALCDFPKDLELA